MNRHQIKEWLFIAFPIIPILFFIWNFYQNNFDRKYIDEHRSEALFNFALLITSFYFAAISIDKKSKFKKWFAQSNPRYQPKITNKHIRKKFFNITLHSDENTIDLINENQLIATFYLQEKKVKKWGFINKQYTFQNLNSLLVVFDDITNFSFFRDTSLETIFTAQFYLMTNGNKTIKLFRVETIMKKHNGSEIITKNSLHSEEDYYRLFTDFSKLVSDLSGLPVLTYNPMHQ